MDAQKDRQSYELNHIVQIDTTTISTDETNEYYIINTKWLENWIDYVQQKTTSRPGLIFNEVLMVSVVQLYQSFQAKLLTLRI